MMLIPVSFCHMHRAAFRGQKGFTSLELLQLTISHLTWVVLGIKPRSSEEQRVFLTTELSLQSSNQSRVLSIHIEIFIDFHSVRFS